MDSPPAVAELADPPSPRRAEAAAWAAVGALWMAVFVRWWPAWAASSEQFYGWLVPLLAAGLAAERWPSRPSLAPIPNATRTLAWIGLATAGLALPLVLAVLAANPLWPLAQWVAVGIAVGASALALAVFGGRAYAHHFLFPLLFIATALTWPTMVTQRLVAGLVALNTQLAATFVSLAGHPAVVHGATIELANGYVGVEEACSGLRSLETVWMSAWFFGEYFMLGLGRRFRLVIEAGLLATAMNAVRTTALTWLAATRGVAASARWHDRFSVAEVVVTLVGVGLIAWRTGARHERLLPAAPRRDRRRDASVADRGSMVGLGAIALIAFIGPEAWYRWHEWRRPIPRIQWELKTPDATWRPVAIPDASRALLNATAAAGLRRQELGGEAAAFVVRWTDDVARAAAADWHDPTVCVPASGRSFTRMPARPRVEIAGVPIEFSVGRFMADEQPHWIFYCHWDAWLGRSRAAEPASMIDVQAWRMERVRSGRRKGDACYIVLVTTANNEGEAEGWLREWAPQLLARR